MHHKRDVTATHHRAEGPALFPIPAMQRRKRFAMFSTLREETISERPFPSTAAGLRSTRVARRVVGHFSFTPVKETVDLL